MAKGMYWLLLLLLRFDIQSGIKFYMDRTSVSPTIEKLSNFIEIWTQKLESNWEDIVIPTTLQNKQLFNFEIFKRLPSLIKHLEQHP